jgi:GNAT superfamily N-acetyltransferase
MDEAKFTAKPVTEANWRDLEALFEGKGGPGYCWCMAFRPMKRRGAAGKADRKAALRGLVRAGAPIGILGYAGGEAVAWCSVAPRETFAKLKDGQDAEPARVWSVTCFFVRRDHRKAGLSGRMLEAAAALARKHGAEVLEGYAVAPDSPSYRHMGFLPLFEAHGFRETGRAGSRRHVMQRKLSAS